MTIFFSSHVLEVVEKLCTRVAVIHEGALKALWTIDEIRSRTGHSSDTPLEEIFVDLVGRKRGGDDIPWVRG